MTDVHPKSVFLADYALLFFAGAPDVVLSEVKMILKIDDVVDASNVE